MEAIPSLAVVDERLDGNPRPTEDRGSPEHFVGALDQ